MNIFIRVDASSEIGTGHVMRCLTLANKFANKGSNITFLCRNHKGNLINIIKREKYPVLTLVNLQQKGEFKQQNEYSLWLGTSQEKDAQQTINLIKDYKIDLLVVDHYALDSNWEIRLRDFADKLLVIDDLANRPHFCDFLLDQNFYEKYEGRYINLIPSHTRTFLGPKYALLRDEFFQMEHFLKSRNGVLNHIMVFFGGSDPSNETLKALLALIQIKWEELKVDVVVGESNYNKGVISQICANNDFISFHQQVNNMAELMNKADLFIGAGGTTTWERCFMGLPAVIITTAKNQENIIETLEKYGAIKYLGAKEEVSEGDIRGAVEELKKKPLKIKYMSHLSKQVLGKQAKYFNTFIEALYERKSVE